MVDREVLRDRYVEERDRVDRQLNKADYYVSKYAEDAREAQRNLDMWLQSQRDSQVRADELDILIDALEEEQ